MMTSGCTSVPVFLYSEPVCVCVLICRDVVSFTVLQYLAICYLPFNALDTDNRAHAKVLSLFEMPQPDTRLYERKT